MSDSNRSWENLAMSNRAALVFAALLLALSACATQPRAAAAGSSGTAARAKPLPAATIVCEDEAPLGSHIKERVCRPMEDPERERRAAQIELLKPKAGPKASAGSGQ